jgi:hypothetical protein
MPYEEPHVDRAVEGIQQKIQVYIPTKFTSTNRAAKRGIGFLAARLEKAFAERCNEIAVTLAASQHG